MKDQQREALSAFNFKQSYARYNPALKRRETWDESVERVMAMHRKHLGPQRAEALSKELAEIEAAYKARRILGSQRSLQFGGEAVLKKHPRSYNCFDEQTQFVARDGVRSFADYRDGDEVEVLTHTGAWRSAVVRSYGEQRLYDIEIKRGGATYKVRATKDHRWLLRGGGETTELSEGDALLGAPSLFREFAYEDADPFERLYWCYGFVYGDGTKVKGKDGTYRSSMVRLCGYASKYAERFVELGFKTSQPLSCNGDFMAYTGKYLKTAPDPSVDSPELIRAFVAGYLAADGARNSNYKAEGSTSKYVSIQATGEEECEFVRRCFPVAGVYIVSEKELTGQQTNYTGGEGRPYTVLFRISAGDFQARTTAAPFRVSSITPSDVERVWCLEVEGDHSFVLPFGVSTGNCTVCYIDKPQRFAEALYLLLCGAGVGYSVQWHHVATLPTVLSAPELSQRPQVSHVIEDTIEGWCEALDALVLGYMGLRMELPCFDYSQIRVEGSPISSCGGKAPGPFPLRVMLSEAERLLRSRAGQTLRPCDASDLMCIAADCVRAGGVRRAALICMFSPDDTDMIAYKSADQWWNTHPYRARANVSALVLREDKDAEAHFRRIFEKTRAYGEPGTIWAESTEVAYNPCVTGDTLVTLANGERVRIDSFVGRRAQIAIDPRFGCGDKGWTSARGAFVTGQREVFRLTLSDEKALRLTADHQVMTSVGWVEAQHLTPAHLIHTEGGNTARLVSFVSEGEETVYDLTQPDTSSFIANGVVVHNCVEIGMVPTLIKDAEGEVVENYTARLLDPTRRERNIEQGYTYETGWQFCNLTEINVAAWKDKEDARDAVRLATLLGLIQASYTLTDDDWLHRRTCTREILEREYLLGVSLTGLGSAPAWARSADVLEHLGRYASIVAQDEWANVGLKACPARVTCVKPSGNAAVILGCSSGVHAEHAERFIRRVQAPKNSPIVQAFAEANPLAAEDSVWSALGTDYALSFAVEVPKGALTKDQQTAAEFLDFVRMVQRCWVASGTVRPSSVSGVTHNVSNTCTVHPHEWDEVRDHLLKYREEFGGVSCLSASGDYDYPQAPFQRVYAPDEISEDDPKRGQKLAAWELWNELRASHVSVDYDSVIEGEDNTELMGEVACAGGACELKL